MLLVKSYKGCQQDGQMPVSLHFEINKGHSLSALLLPQVQTVIESEANTSSGLGGRKSGFATDQLYDPEQDT